MDDPLKLINQAKVAGVEFKVVDDELRIKAADEHWLDRLKPYKAEILACLNGEPTEAELSQALGKQNDCKLPGSAEPVMLKMSDVEPRPIEWLWRGRIALGRITLLVGRPGCGKSYLTCDMVSRVSTGTPWPDGEACPHGSAILIACEDDPHDTIRPRLDAHEADASRITLLRSVKRRNSEGRESESMFSLSDLDALEAAIQQRSDCKLIVIDPIGSYLGGKTDSYRDNEVRDVLAPVALLAEKYGVAVIVVCHTRKGAATSADDMAMGSRAFTGIARGVWHVSIDSDDKGRRLLLPGKSNLAPEQGGMAFSIAGEPASVHWESEAVAMTADEQLAKANGNASECSALDEAGNWLRDQLSDGPMQSKVIQQLARSDGIAQRTLERAKARLGVTAGPDGLRGPWVWQLPASVTDSQTEGTESANITPECPQSASLQTLANSSDSGEHLANSGEQWWQEPPEAIPN